jgi:hypothetical protein
VADRLVHVAVHLVNLGAFRQQVAQRDDLRGPAAAASQPLPPALSDDGGWTEAHLVAMLLAQVHVVAGVLAAADERDGLHRAQGVHDGVRRMVLERHKIIIHIS